MHRSAPRGVGEEQWFLRWLATVESKLAIYARIFDDLYLRPADVEQFVETGVCRDILAEAVRNREAEWQRAAEMLRSTEPLEAIVAEPFGEEVPALVGLVALQEIRRRDEGSERLDAAIGREVEKREDERRSLGLPTYVWAVEIGPRGKMSVLVRPRDELGAEARGLVSVVETR